VGELQRTLEQPIGRVGDVSHGTLRFPSASDVASSEHADAVETVYRQLGGVLPRVPVNLRPWDMEFSGLAIELDEYLHFNRYRGATLASPAYHALPAFPLEEYRAFCPRHEERCLRAGGYGGKWSNTSCETQFGHASKPKDLSGYGAPRWKQRAFYDFVKDLSPVMIDVTVVRVAVWDEVVDSGRSRTVEEVLSAPWESSADAMAAFIRQRTAR
jgi:hypothetical protein